MDTMIRQCRQGASTWSVNTAGGEVDLIVCDMSTYDDVVKLLRPYLRYNNNTKNIAWGIETFTYKGIPVMYSKFLDTATTTKRMLFLDTRFIEMVIGLDMTMERLAKVEDANKFMIKWYGALAVKAENFSGQYDTIT
jgi:hypothetical protein